MRISKDRFFVAGEGVAQFLAFFLCRHTHITYTQIHAQYPRIMHTNLRSAHYFDTTKILVHTRHDMNTEYLNAYSLHI